MLQCLLFNRDTEGNLNFHHNISPLFPQWPSNICSPWTLRFLDNAARFFQTDLWKSSPFVFPSSQSSSWNKQNFLTHSGQQSAYSRFKLSKEPPVFDALQTHFSFSGQKKARQCRMTAYLRSWGRQPFAQKENVHLHKLDLVGRWLRCLICGIQHQKPLIGSSVY